MSAALFNLPAALTERKQFVLWAYDEDKRKIPYRVDGRRASPTRPEDWSEYSEVVESFSRGRSSGIGYVFHASDPFVGTDFDDCLEDVSGDPKPCVREALNLFRDTYSEISPSGLGIKLWAKGTLPTALKVKLKDGVGIELYDRARYFTITGNVFRHAPLQIAEHAADILSIYHELGGFQAQGPQFQASEDGKIPHGQQHNTLVSIVGAVRARRVREDLIEDFIQRVNREMCEKPGKPGAIRRIVLSTRRWSA